ncbi:MAG: SpoIVB peptidase S55 domain-containing protein, partial [Anaerovoracaceae bacterium]|nr:SpoIVB peptidase S55 domain-containing protein [Anaerovoracaceae bacterium]
MRIFIMALCLCLQLAVAAASNVSFMPIRDLRPGMQGIGKTVIQGDTIEEFNVEILGVQGSEATGYSIFVRLYGDLIEKTGGVAQGMSGSPVY